MTPSRPIAGLPRVIVPRLATTETERADHEGAGGADRQDGRGEDGTPNSHDDLHASTEGDSCELVLAAMPGTTDRTDHRQSSADYRK